MKKQSKFVFFKLGVQTGSLETWEGNFHVKAAGVLIILSGVMGGHEVISVLLLSSAYPL